ncbi:hypothetical protein [Bartonella tribocorum]|nr:hypothetical protein [Bartonella tribocorum]
MGEKMCGSPVLQGAYAESVRVGICGGIGCFFVLEKRDVLLHHERFPCVI